MKCPYKQSSLIHQETLKHDLINEESGIAKGNTVVILESFHYCDCIK